MANIKSAKKRAKQTVVRNARNVAQRSQLRTAVKKVIKALDANDAAGATEAFATAQPLRDRFARIAQPLGLPEKAAFYAGCLIDFAYPEMGEAVVKLLNKAGIQVVFPAEQTCCGAPARYSGAYDVAARNAA